MTVFVPSFTYVFSCPRIEVPYGPMKLAKAIGKHFSPIFVSAEPEKKEDVLEMEMDQSISSESATSNSLFDDDKEPSSDEMSDRTTPNLTHLLNFEEYPLFHHHRLNI